MNQDLNEGDELNGATVAKRYFSGLGCEAAVMEPGQHTDEEHLIREMAQLGWTYHFTRDSTGRVFFKDADEWDMEPGAGNS